jgi:hypothetical protein
MFCSLWSFYAGIFTGGTICALALVAAYFIGRN